MSTEASTKNEWMMKALQYQELLWGARRERDSALALHDKAAEQLRQYKERAETAERERDAAVVKAAEMKEELELAHSQGRQAEAIITQERDAALAHKAKAEEALAHSEERGLDLRRRRRETEARERRLVEAASKCFETNDDNAPDYARNLALHSLRLAVMNSDAYLDDTNTSKLKNAGLVAIGGVAVCTETLK